VGLVVGYPTTVGVVWRLNDRFTFRGDGFVNWSSTKTGAPVSSTLGFDVNTVTSDVLSVITSKQESSTTNAGVGVSALITLSRVDRFTTYIAPRMSWSASRTHTQLEYQISGLQFLPDTIRRLYAPEDFTTTQHTPTISALFGASAAVHDRFSVFGEAGFGYSWTTLPGFPIRTATVVRDSRQKSFGLRSGIGAVIYF